MATRKLNEYLDVVLSENDEDFDHDSEELEDARNSRLNGLSSGGSKRRKVDDVDEDVSDGSDDEEDDSGGITAVPMATISSSKVEAAAEPISKQKNPKLKPLTPSQLAKSQRKARKTGVMYLSRIPPFMRPSTIRHLLIPYGTISRLFLTPEPPTTYARRIKAGGNKKRSFVDGWVEFASKKHAKICAGTLNGEIIGGKKGGWYHDDLWNIKYLKGFKWDDLMAQAQEEERIREGRMRAEIQRETRERKAFLGNVEAAKKEKTREAKRKKKEEGGKGGFDGSGAIVKGVPTLVKESGKKGFERRFRQNEVRTRGPTDQMLQEQPDDVKRVLSKIF